MPMAKRVFTPLFDDDFERAKADLDRASEAVGKRLDGMTVPGKPVPIVDGNPLPQKMVFTGEKGQDNG